MNISEKIIKLEREGRNFEYPRLGKGTDLEKATPPQTYLPQENPRPRAKHSLRVQGKWIVPRRRRLPED